jgi:hypothetical protein
MISANPKGSFTGKNDGLKELKIVIVLKCMHKNCRAKKFVSGNKF